MDEVVSPAAESTEPSHELTKQAMVTSHGRSILLNFGSLSTGALFSRLMGLATNAVLARRVSTAGYGMTGIAQTITIYFGLLSDLGLGTVAIREGAQRPEKLQRVISSMLGLQLALAAAAAGAASATAAAAVLVSSDIGLSPAPFSIRAPSWPRLDPASSQGRR